MQYLFVSGLIFIRKHILNLTIGVIYGRNFFGKDILAVFIDDLLSLGALQTFSCESSLVFAADSSIECTVFLLLVRAVPLRFIGEDMLRLF